MTVSEEQLMSLVDGECSPEERAFLEECTLAHPEMARRCAAQRALRLRLRACFDPVLEEPVPHRLLRAASIRQSAGLRPMWLAAAASLLIGLVLGAFMLKLFSVTGQAMLSRGEVIADATLARGLSEQLASAPASGPVRVGVSFVSRTGQYCRTFIDARERDTVIGLACRDADAWRLKLVESGASKPVDRETYLQAATSISPAILKAVEALRKGDLLDADGEAAARAKGWRPFNSARR